MPFSNTTKHAKSIGKTSALPSISLSDLISDMQENSKVVFLFFIKCIVTRDSLQFWSDSSLTNNTLELLVLVNLKKTEWLAKHCDVSFDAQIGIS